MNRPWEGIALALFLAAYCAMGMPTQSKEYQMEPLNHVDVVYTWVNGSDAKHRQARGEYLQLTCRDSGNKCAENLTAGSFSPSRYEDHDELRYSIRTVEKYLPWIRNIFIVTNGQVPAWLNLSHPRIRLVTHREIFNNPAHLPTFSSNAIEFSLHRIPGLSDNFLYFNDDVMLGRPVSLEDFYSSSEGLKIYKHYRSPGCAPGCPDRWLKDGRCHKACNVSTCRFDLGDCLPKVDSKDLAQNGSQVVPLRSVRWSLGSGGPPKVQVALAPPRSSHKDGIKTCAPDCHYGLIGDGVCDAACNNQACGFDMFDCNAEDALSLPSAFFLNYEKARFFPGVHTDRAFVLDLSVLVQDMVIEQGYYDKSSEAVMVAIARQLNTMVVLRDRKIRDMSMRVVLVGTYSNGTRAKVTFEIQSPGKVTLDPNESLSPSIHESIVVREVDVPLPGELLNCTRHCDLTDCLYFVSQQAQKPLTSVSASNADTVKRICQAMVAGCMTAHKFKVLVEEVSELWNNPSEPGNREQWEALRRSVESDFEATLKTADSPSNYAMQRTAAKSVVPTSKMDGFALALIHTSMVFHEEFGVKERFVIPHMPLLLNRHVMDELVALFSDEVDITTSHRFRHPQDLQLGMAYTSFIRECGEPYSPEALLERVDENGDGNIDSRKLDRLFSYLRPSLRIFRSPSQLRELLDHCLKGCSSNYSHPLAACSIALESCEPTLSKVINIPQRIPKYLHSLHSDPRSFAMVRVSSKTNPKDIESALGSKFICFNDDFDYADAKSYDVLNAYRNILNKAHPKRSEFELADSESQS